ncbi:MAG: hypothetical protein WCZ65_04605 [Lysobacteraceae bacterium]
MAVILNTLNTPVLPYLIACVAAVVVALWLYQRRLRQRTDLLERLLDGTDALEAALKATRQRMAAMRSVVDRVPADIAAVAQASLDADEPVQQALRNVLEHRLWIARSAQDASLDELRAAVNAIERSRQQIESRLGVLESAGAELAEATRGALEQAAREPAALRRQDGPGQ